MQSRNEKINIRFVLLKHIGHIGCIGHIDRTHRLYRAGCIRHIGCIGHIEQLFFNRLIISIQCIKNK